MKPIVKSKKGQLTGNLNMLIFGSVLFVVVVVILVVGATVVTTLRTNVGRNSNSVVNESDASTLVWGNNTNMTLNNREVSVLSVFNCTAGADLVEDSLISASDYTVFGTEGFIQADTNSTGTPHDGNAVCVNYTHLDLNAAYNVSGQGESGFKVFGDYLGVIATIIVLVVIVGLLIGVFVLFGRR